jgi:hypothetical protein
MQFFFKKKTFYFSTKMADNKAVYNEIGGRERLCMLLLLIKVFDD